MVFHRRGVRGGLDGYRHGILAGRDGHLLGDDRNPLWQVPEFDVDRPGEVLTIDRDGEFGGLVLRNVLCARGFDGQLPLLSRLIPGGLGPGFAGAVEVASLPQPAKANTATPKATK